MMCVEAGCISIFKSSMLANFTESISWESIIRYYPVLLPLVSNSTKRVLNPKWKLIGPTQAVYLNWWLRVLYRRFDFSHVGDSDLSSNQGALTSHLLNWPAQICCLLQMRANQDLPCEDELSDLLVRFSNGSNICTVQRGNPVMILARCFLMTRRHRLFIEVSGQISIFPI